MNNLDSSSTGVTLDLNVSYDSDLSQMWFDDSMVNLYRSGGSLLNCSYSRVDCWLYTQSGEFTDDFDLSDLDNYDLKSATNKSLLLNLRVVFYGQSEDLKDDSLTYFSKYPYQLTKREIIELAENVMDSSDYLEFLLNNFKAKYSVLSSRGYSQGDYIECVVPWSLWGGKEPTDLQLQSTQTEIDNLFWDAPIYQVLEIDGEQFNIDNFVADRYEYDKSESLQIVNDNLEHEKKLYIMQWLTDNLPDQPVYEF